MSSPYGHFTSADFRKWEECFDCRPILLRRCVGFIILTISVAVLRSGSASVGIRCRRYLPQVGCVEVVTAVGVQANRDRCTSLKQTEGSRNLTDL